MALTFTFTPDPAPFGVGRGQSGRRAAQGLLGWSGTATVGSDSLPANLTPIVSSARPDLIRLEFMDAASSDGFVPRVVPVAGAAPKVQLFKQSAATGALVELGANASTGNIRVAIEAS